ncbi:PepSY-associated TM helix domain-containing protein [Acanthopleuribacter pedis]|uniref:PepSY domain-containing protein n=1 Tax=Acanthopleuribacter pedis TaxID=442870 RepID=A0A8J7U632_9BACT|nr:PepSY-associated TM helix domain-containing protein [Acanthopleuribacter pedis]MBO1323193.1 PepSY domain-containing protein [Acanthopleuribacter pedis]
MALKKKNLWRLHSWMGLLAGVPMLLIALTGSWLVFKPELDALLLPERHVVAPSPDGRLAFDELLARVRQAHPDQVVVGWSVSEQAARADVLFLVERGQGMWRKLYLDAQQGRLLSGPLALEDGINDWLLSLHYTLLGGHLGMLVAGVIALLLLGLGITGFMIYRRFWRRMLQLNFRQAWRGLAGEFHRKLGVLAAPLFLIMGVTGAYWNITHAVADLAEHGLSDEHEVVTRSWLGDSLSLDQLVANSVADLKGYRPFYIALPYQEQGGLTFYGQVPERGFLRGPYGITFTYHRETGALQAKQDIREQHAAVQLVDAFRPLHFGNFGGLPVKIFYCVFGMMPAWLALSGFAVFFLRRGKKGKASVPKQITEDRAEAA